MEAWTEIPLWVPRPKRPGLFAHHSEDAEAAGLTWRPLAETLADTWAWQQAVAGGWRPTSPLPGSQPDREANCSPPGTPAERPHAERERPGSGVALHRLGGCIPANPIAPDHLLNSFGLIGLAIILFAECGLLVGFFLPGDTLLLSAGISLAIGTIHTSLAAYLIVAPIAAVAGNIVGYGIGRRVGPVVFDRPNSKCSVPST